MLDIFKINLNPKEIIYYISEEKLDLKNIEKSFGHIQITLNINTMIVISLYSRKKGCGTKLMVYSCKEQLKKGIKYVELDDCTKRYRMNHNIYTKLGMKYVDDYGPEMKGLTQIISTHLVF